MKICANYTNFALLFTHYDVCASVQCALLCEYFRIVLCVCVCAHTTEWIFISVYRPLFQWFSSYKAAYYGLMNKNEWLTESAHKSAEIENVLSGGQNMTRNNRCNCECVRVCVCVFVLIPHAVLYERICVFFNTSIFFIVIYQIRHLYTLCAWTILHRITFKVQTQFGTFYVCINFA